MGRGNIRVRQHAIEAEIQRAVRVIEEEINCYGTFQEQYDALEGFRNELLQYVRWASRNRKLFRPKTSFIESGDVLDWHVTGYFAPLEFKRVSWGGKKRTPSEHVIALSNALKRKGSRLLYVALPCKGVIYPELAVDRRLVREGASTAPQWRKMVLEMLEGGVEVIDMFPVFQKHKTKPLFSYEHNISPEGAELTACTIGDYIKRTSTLEDIQKNIFTAHEDLMWYYPWQTNAPEKQVRLYKERYIKKDGLRYLPFGNDSDICIFGNCNLQAYLYRGSGIAANLAYQLQRDIDYLGRKLIFGNGKEVYDKESFCASAERDIAICISFPSGSFVRTSQLNRGGIKRLIMGQGIEGSWSTQDSIIIDFK